MASGDQDEWVRRVLGVALPGGGVEEGAPVLAPGAKLLPFWMAAKEAVDSHITQLQASLREFDDPDLNQVAEFGLNGITTRQSVAMMAALRGADTADTPAERASVLGAVERFRDFLEAEPIVDLLEESPFGHSVPLRAIFGAALDQIEERAGG